MLRSEILNELKKVIASRPDWKVDVSLINEETNFQEDAGFDSLDSLELILEVEKHFKISLPEGEEHKIKTVKILIDIIEKLV